MGFLFFCLAFRCSLFSLRVFYGLVLYVSVFSLFMFELSPSNNLVHVFNQNVCLILQCFRWLLFFFGKRLSGPPKYPPLFTSDSHFVLISLQHHC